MKRKALLIGNSNGLAGVKLDIANWMKFLKSEEGGQWCDKEIDVVMNPKKSDILSRIANIKASSPDFVITVFSGHGAYQRKAVGEQTILGINNNEVIGENDLIGIALRQISVFDCCRGVSAEVLSESQKEVGAFSKGGSVRPYYEKRIMEAMPQQIRLYACAIGESAMDTERGGIYTNQLLYCSSSFLEGEDYRLVAKAHRAAAEGTRSAALGSNHTQNPDAIFQPKYPPEQQQLIIGINPSQIDES